MEIKDINTKGLLLETAAMNAHLSNSKKRRRQVFRLHDLINKGDRINGDDSDVIKTVFTVLDNMESLHMTRYGAMAYVEWYGRPPKDLVEAGFDKTHRYKFSSSDLRDPIQMYNDCDVKIEGASIQLLTFIFNLSAGVDLRDTLGSLSDMSLHHINLSMDNAKDEEVDALYQFANFVDNQNGNGAFAAGLMYPILNKDFGKKRKHAVFGYGSNTGKGLLLAIINKLYVGAPVQMTVRPNERDVYSTGAWNKMVINRWVVILGDSSESNLTYDFMKNFYEQPQAISGKNERGKEMFYGNVYIATNHIQDFFSDKEIYTRTFFLAMFADIDIALGRDLVNILDNVSRDSIIKYITENEELARAYWDTYSTPDEFWKDESPERLYENFMLAFDNQIVPVRKAKEWAKSDKQYRKLYEMLKEYHGPSTTLRVDGVSTRVFDLRKKILTTEAIPDVWED